LNDELTWFSRNARYKDMNRDIRHASRNTMIHPLLTKEGRYPYGFQNSRRLVDLMRMRDRDIDDLMRAYGCHSECTDRKGNRGESASPRDRKHDRNQVSLDQLRNLEVLFNFLGAYHVADQFRQYRKDRHKTHVFNDPEFRIRK
jgi:hypothetical protein